MIFTTMNSTDTSERKVIITGIGGQGIVFLTRLFSYTAVNLGRSVVVSETHGMSQRGGSVISHLKINGSDAPLIQRGSADVMIAMDSNEAMQNMDFMCRGGMVFVNSGEGLHPDLTSHLERLKIRVEFFRHWDRCRVGFARRGKYCDGWIHRGIFHFESSF